MKRRRIIIALLVAAGATGVAGAAGVLVARAPDAPNALGAHDDERSPEALFAFYAPRPQHERPIPYQAPPAGLASITAKSCGECHTAIYAEWQQSIHADAWRDRQFQAEMHKNPAVGWLCVNCHTPLLNQIERVVTRLNGDASERGEIDKPVTVRNPYFTPEFRAEGISCATCHVRDGVILGPWGRREAAPHPVRKDPGLLAADVCLQCHQATASYLGRRLICVFETGDEWRAGPDAKAGTACQSCHMPEVTRPIVKTGSPRAGRRHLWVGAGIPKDAAPNPERDKLWALMEPGLKVNVEGLKPRYRPGERLAVHVRYTNARAGHMLPTGDPERFYLITARLLDGKGREAAREEVRIGRVFEWEPAAKELSDNRLKPRESRVLSFSPRLPAAPGPYTLHVTAAHHRISAENAEYHRLGPDYPRARTIFDERYIIPLRVER